MSKSVEEDFIDGLPELLARAKRGDKIAEEMIGEIEKMAADGGPVAKRIQEKMKELGREPKEVKRDDSGDVLQQDPEDLASRAARGEQDALRIISRIRKMGHSPGPRQREAALLYAYILDFLD
jgi:hypothetical protein